LKRVGRTSITIHVLVEADRKGELVQVTQAELTYVAVEVVDGVRRPVPIRGPNKQHVSDQQQQQ
jgi:acyl-CoA hydrolase